MPPSSAPSAGSQVNAPWRARVALAWQSVVTAPIVGATKVAHLDHALAALDLVLTQNEIAALEAPYRPKEIAGHE
jgi:aryl-alcohol dehydrogenase (NADP+)